MKKFKKVLLALLAISIIASGLCVFASAESDSEAEILEYYEGVNFVDQDFDGIADTDEISLNEVFSNAPVEFVYDDFGENLSVKDGVLTFSNIGTAHIGMMFSDLVQSGIGLNTSFAFTDSNSGDYLAISLHTGDFNSGSNDTLPLFIKSKDGVKIADGEGYSYSNAIVESDFYTSIDNLEKNVYYTVQIFCSLEEYGISGSVVVYGNNKECLGSSQFSLSGYSPVSLAISSISSDKTPNTVSMDYLEIYAGSFPRTLSDFDYSLGEMIISISKGEDYVDLMAACKVISEYKFNTDKIEDAVKAQEIDEAIKSITLCIAQGYKNDFTDGVQSIDSSLDYVSRKSLIDSISNYANAIKHIRDSYIDEWQELNSESNLDAYIEAYDAEYNALKHIEAETLAYVSTVDSIANPSSATYAELYNANIILSEKELCASYRAEGYDEDRMNAVAEKGAEICAAYKAYVDRGIIFVDNVIIAKENLLGDSVEASFIKGYNAFQIAKQNHIQDSTYVPDPEKYETFASVNEDYNLCATYMSGVEKIANGFLAAISEYEVSSSFTVKVSAIDKARGYLSDLQMEYPGIAEAFDKYEAAVKYLNDIRALSRDYIKAVVAVETAGSLAERKTAIAYAKSLSAGADSSIDVIYQGVTVLQANILLSAADSAIKYAETIVVNFIASVEAIADMDTVETRRAAIITALELKAGLVNVNVADNPNPSGMNKCITDLTVAIQKYNQDIEVANAVAVQASEVASATVCATVGADLPINKVVAIIKKIYD